MSSVLPFDEINSTDATHLSSQHEDSCHRRNVSAKADTGNKIKINTFCFCRVELVSNYSQLPYRNRVPRDKTKKDEVPDIARDTAFEPAVILKMLQALRTDMFPVEGRQEDAEEFLSFILNRMNDEMIEVRVNAGALNAVRFLIAFISVEKARREAKADPQEGRKRR